MYELITSNGSKLLVAKNDLNIKMSWVEAMEYCSNVSDGWRLPTPGELRLMYRDLQLQSKGDFEEVGYWSMKEFDEFAAQMIFFNKPRGGHGIITKQHKAPIRLVKKNDE